MPVARPRWSASTTRSSSEMADTVNIADPMPPTPRSSEQLRVGLREARQRAADGHDRDARGQDDALAEPVDQPPAAECRHQPHEREGRDHRARSGVVDPELLGEEREAGATTPKPTATLNATAVRTRTSRGRPAPTRKGASPVEAVEARGGVSRAHATRRAPAVYSAAPLTQDRQVRASDSGRTRNLCTVVAILVGSSRTPWRSADSRATADDDGDAARDPARHGQGERPSRRYGASRSGR